MTIKKAYVEVVALLEANVNLSVGDVLDEVKRLCSVAAGTGSRMGNSIIRDDNGDVVAIFCTYHQKWELLDEVEFSGKTSAPSGFNSLCKIGVAALSASAKAAKAAEAALLDQVFSGEVAPADIPRAKEAIKEAQAVKSVRGDGHGFATKADAIAALAA